MDSIYSGILVLDSAMDTILPPPPGPTFRQRCAASLTHPVTLFAVLVLLLNDLVLKALWSNPWTTGKLSDLAWVIFASPLLVTLLSPLAGVSVVRQRVVFLTAYVGLPALYAAFNTIQPLHDWILGGFRLLTNGFAGSPLDVTDSLVIPFGLAVALWVWKQSGVERANLRTRLTLFAVGVAVFATIATSPSPVDYGITSIEIGEGGTLMARSHNEAPSLEADYLSSDGGFTWTVQETSTFASALVSADRVDTPRGPYIIEGPNVWYEPKEGSREVIYSTPNWTDANVWIQSKSTRFAVRALATQPYGMVYHEQSRNIIVAMGIQGVAVVTPNGKWAPVAVAHYQSGSFARVGKMMTLLADHSFWLPSLAVALSFTLLALILSTYKSAYPLDFCTLVAVFVSAVLSSLLLIVIVGSPAFEGLPESHFDILARSSLELPVILVVYTFCFLACLMARKQLRRWRVLSMGLAIITLILIVVFSTWIQTGIALWVAKFSALVLSGLAVWALTKLYARGQGNSILRDDQTQKS